MTAPSNAEQARHADEAMRTFLLADGRTGLNPSEAITALLTSLRHYADQLGTDFGYAVGASSADYARQRQYEEHAYAVGQEIRLRTRAVLGPPLASLPARGVVEALYPGTSGTQMYAIRFPGETNPMPFTGNEIEPAPAFPRLNTSRGDAVTSLVQAEDLLTKVITRIRDQHMRNLPPDQADISDRNALLAILGEICDLSPGEILTQFEHKAARTGGFHALATASEPGRRHGNAEPQPFGSPEQTGSPAQPAARDFPDLPRGSAAPATDDSARAAACRRTPHADPLSGPQRHSQ